MYLPATDFDEGTPQYFIKAVRLQPDGTYVADFGVYLPGEAVGGVLFGPGGTAYQTVQSGNSVVVRNLATEADDAFLTGQAHGPAVIGEDGTIYLVTTRTDQQTGGISGQIVYVTPGDFPRGFGTSPDFEGPLILGPDGTAYLTSRTPGRQAGDQDDGTVIVTIRDGAFDTIPYDGVPAGTVRFAPDGTAYQITQSPVGSAAPVTMIYRLYDDNPEPVRLNGRIRGGHLRQRWQTPRHDRASGVPRNARVLQHGSAQPEGAGLHGGVRQSDRIDAACTRRERLPTHRSPRVFEHGRCDHHARHQREHPCTQSSSSWRASPSA